MDEEKRWWVLGSQELPQVGQLASCNLFIFLFLMFLDIIQTVISNTLVPAVLYLLHDVLITVHLARDKTLQAAWKQYTG